MIIVNLINNLPFCGQQGLSQGSASSSLYATGLGFSNDEKMQYLWVAALAIIICMTCMFMFVRSKYGRCIRAIRDNEIAASASGINVSYYKMLTFTISAFFAGITMGLTYGKTMDEACEIGTRLSASVICTSENVCPRFLPSEFGLEPGRAAGEQLTFEI